MSWNNSDKDKDQNKGKPDPWSGNSKEKGPPDLDAMIKQLRKKLVVAFSGGKGGDGGGSKDIKSAEFGTVGVVIALVVAAVLWALSGIFIIRPAEQAVVLRFGKYLTTVGPGPHWIPLFIDSIQRENVKQLKTINSESEMLTQDINIIHVKLSVIYRIENLRDYLFNVVNPQDTLAQATAAALRQVVGQTNMDSILSSGREIARDKIKKTLIATMSNYNTGIFISDVNLQLAKPPHEVADAFDDALKAQADQTRLVNQAEAYSIDIIPKAQGEAVGVVQLADAEKQRLIMAAEGDIAAFNALLPQLEHAPDVTRERLYLDTIEAVLKNSNKILVASGSGNMFYLPLDQLMQQNKKQNYGNESSAENGVPYAPANLVAAGNTLNNLRAPIPASASDDFSNERLPLERPLTRGGVR